MLVIKILLCFVPLSWCHRISGVNCELCEEVLSAASGFTSQFHQLHCCFSVKARKDQFHYLTV